MTKPTEAELMRVIEVGSACADLVETLMENAKEAEVTMENNRVCGNCRWHACEIYPDFICANERSDYAGDYTKYGDTCDDWEEKDERN